MRLSFIPRTLSVAVVTTSITACMSGSGSSTSTSSEDVVYGEDDRIEIAQAPPGVRAAARSVALAVELHKLGPASGGRIPLESQALGERLGLCEDHGERFARQGSLLAGHGTGFLVAPTVIATAKHVAVHEHLGFVFGVEVNPATGMPVDSVPESDVYRATRIVHAPDGKDWSLVVLDRPVPRPVLPLRRNGQAALGRPMVVVGHPNVLPMKAAPGHLRATEGTDLILDADTFKGNSGSPVFDAQTLEVEGILYEGEDDWTGWPLCRRMNHETVAGERAHRIAEVLPLLN